MKKTIVCEIDNVIADTSSRQHLMDVGWQEYHEASSGDNPNEAIVLLLRALSEYGYEILIVTSRPERYDIATIKWLQKHKIPCDELLARGNSDYRPEIEVKLDLIDSYFGSRENAITSVIVALDQKEKVIEEFRNVGFETWSVK